VLVRWSFVVLFSFCSQPTITLPGSQSEITLKSPGPKEQQIMTFLHDRIFDPILNSGTASAKLKQGVRYTIMRLGERDAAGMIQYYWSAIVGTERSVGFAALMRQEGFGRFEEAIDEFRLLFNDSFLRRP
jgi:hypothetical protein